MGDEENITKKEIYDLIQEVVNTNKKIQQQNNEIKEEIKLIKANTFKKLDELQQENDRLKEENQKLQTRVLIAERKQKKYNLMIYGLKENDEEIEDIKALLDVFNTKLEVSCLFEDFRDFQRLGRPVLGKNRPLSVETVNYKLKVEILKNAKKLKGSGIFISPEFAPEDYKKRKILAAFLKRAKKNQHEAKIINNSLVVNGETFTYEDLLDTEEIQGITANVNTGSNEEEQEALIQKPEIDEELRYKAPTESTSTGTKRKLINSPSNNKPLKRSSRIKRTGIKYFT